MARPDAAIAPGSLVLNRYVPIRPLGSGGSGSVWLAREAESGREVALKIVPREGTAGSRAEREAGAAARLRHPRCLRAHALARDAGHVYIVYEYVAGRTMREAMREGELDDAGALEAAAQVLEGLAHAHSHGIVHRDVKPANVLLADGQDVSVKLFDFGLALVREEQGLTAVGDIPGTLAYISPERLRGDGAGPPADVWAVGVLLWEALAGFHPFWTGTLLDTARAIERGAPSLREQRPDLPRPIVGCVDRALAIAPGRRPTAAGLAGGLRQASTELRRRPRVKRKPLVPSSVTRLRLPIPAQRPTRAAVRLSPRAHAAAALLTRLACVGGAGAFAALVATALPFFPSRWPVGIGGVAALLTLVSERAGLAFCLAVPILPLGNYSLGLAAVYAIAAVAALAAAWKAPRAGLAATFGAVLGPAGAVALLPLVAQLVHRPAARAASVFAAVLVAAGLHETARLPGLDLAASPSLLRAAAAVGNAIRANPEIAVRGAALAIGAAALPYVRRRGPVAAVAYAAVVAGLPVAASLHAISLAALAIGVTTGALLAAEPYVGRPRADRPARPKQKQKPARKPASRPAVDETTAAVVRPREPRSATGRR